MARRELKTYDAEFKGRKVRVTVPENDGANALAEAIRDQLSPEGVAAVAAHLQALHPSKKKSADRQVVWFHDFLVGLLGDDEYARLSDELGF
jgi:hypothetical protein